MSSGTQLSGPSEVRGIVLTHGTMCHGMADAVQKITGAEQGVLTAVSNEGSGFAGGVWSRDCDSASALAPR